MPSQTTPFERVLEAMPDSLVGVDQEGIIRFVNHQAELLFGYARDDLVGRPVETLLPESRRQLHQAHRKDFLVDPRTRAMGLGLDLKGRHRDGTEFPADISLSNIDTDDGLLVIAAVRDLDEPKNAETTRHASAITREVNKQRQAFEAARSMIESSLDSLVSISPEGMITDVNEATVKVTGVPREELVGTAFSDYFTEPEKANEIYQRVFAEGMAVDYPLTMRHRDGRLTDVLYNASVQRDASGEVLGVFAAARDVTAQRQAQYARSLIEAGLDPLLTISPEGMITDVNEATVKVTGVPRDELIDTDFSDYFTEPEEANKGYKRAFAEGSVTDYPLTMRHRDGALIDVLYNAAVYRDASGNVLGVFAAARDVTEQKQAQTAIAQQAKELDRLAELERFQRLTVGRELKMIELKKEIEHLRKLVNTDGGRPHGPL